MGSFGENLRRERELRGVSLREMADATKIGLRFLQAIEQDRLDILPGGMFPRAFVRQYANYLGLEPDKLAADFAYYHNDRGAVSPPATNAWPLLKRRVMLGLAAGGIVCSLLLLLWTQRSCGGEQPPVSTLIPAAPVSPRPMVLVVPTPTVATMELKVSLDALNNCWVEAIVDGRPLFSRVLKQEEKVALEAHSQVVLSVGNAGGLALSVNDGPSITLGRSGEVRRDILINKETLPTLLQEAARRPEQKSE
jgi:transcriptional regulator with XRE-family HTH domain